MLNFKFIKNKLKSIKCLLKKAFMVKQNEELPQTSNFKIKNGKLNTRGNSSNCQVPNASSAEGFIPLAARDSQWVGIEFYNPNFRSPFDEEDDVEEVELQNLAADTDAILLLFPGLSKTGNLLLKEHESSSTTEITKLLVGQKADFRGMKSSKKLLPTDKKLDSVQEMQEEKNPSETDISFCRTRNTERPSSSEIEHYDDDEDEPKRSTHTKRRKKKSDVKLESKVSSVSVLEVKKKSSKVRSENLKTRKCELSGQSSFADDERLCTGSFIEDEKKRKKKS